MLTLTWKLVNSFTILSDTTNQESHQSFLCILLLLLSTNILIEQYCHSCSPRTEILQEKCRMDVRTEKQEREGLYLYLTYDRNQVVLFRTLQSNHLNFSS